MKNLRLVFTASFLLTVYFLLPSCKPKEEHSDSASGNNALSNPMCDFNDPQSNKVKLEKARFDIEMYSWWWTYAMPTMMHYNPTTASLSFDSVTVPKDTVKDLLASFHSKMPSIPFHSQNLPNVAYVISAEDIREALGIPLSGWNTSYDGLRVYLAMSIPKFDEIPVNDPVKMDSLYTIFSQNEISTHLYVVPVNKLPNNEYEDIVPACDNPGTVKKFAYDLTTPCPASCDPKSPLYKATQPY